MKFYLNKNITIYPKGEPTRLCVLFTGVQIGQVFIGASRPIQTLEAIMQPGYYRVKHPDMSDAYHFPQDGDSND
jgi:hypothetical protein